jgi:hypothetical protein
MMSDDPRFDLPAFDRLYEQALSMPDGAEREAVMWRAKDLLVATRRSRCTATASRWTWCSRAPNTTGATPSCATSGVSST